MKDLTWENETVVTAVTDDGRRYQIQQNWNAGKPYVAVLTFTDRSGRLFSHLVGYFDTVYEAKKACQTDSKS